MPDKTFLDWPFFTDAHRKFAHELDAWCAKNLAELSHKNVDQTCRYLVRLLGSGGWLNHAAIDPDESDSRLDVRLLCLARETLARHDGLADFAFAMQGLGSGAIGLFGHRQLQKQYLPAVRTGEKIAAFALSEPNAGSDVAAMTTNAVKDGDEFVINGTKTWISNGGIADFYVVFARTGDAGGARDISAFLIDADTPGLDASKRIDVIAPHPLATLEFSDCRIPVERLLGEPGKGFKVAMSVLDIFRSTVGAAALGFARRAFHEAVMYAKTREMFGKTLADLDLTQEKLAEMALDVDASALLIYRAAWTKDCAQDRVTREAAMAKLYATESAQQVIDKAVQIFGGKGVESGNIVESLYREIRALRIYEGASEVQKLIIGRQVLS
ncbi:MAG: acyl-CoA dehydrogenase family protein [Gammaproteobacteria bacterium]